jgi:hypothetical protein
MTSEYQQTAIWIVINGLPWLLSAITIWMTVLAGNKHPSAWLVGLFGQLGWSVWIVTSATWGLLPLNVVLWYLYTKNHFKWSVT